MSIRSFLRASSPSTFVRASAFDNSFWYEQHARAQVRLRDLLHHVCGDRQAGDRTVRRRKVASDGGDERGAELLHVPLLQARAERLPVHPRDLLRVDC